MKSYLYEEGGPPWGVAVTEISQVRACAALPWCSESGAARCRSRSHARVYWCGSSQSLAAQWSRWFVIVCPAAAVVSERWAGPNVGPSVARLPRVCSRARALSLSLLARSLLVSPLRRGESLPIELHPVEAAAAAATITRRVVTEWWQASWEEAAEGKDSRGPIVAPRLDPPWSRCRRPRTSNRPPPTHRFRNARRQRRRTTRR